MGRLALDSGKWLMPLLTARKAMSWLAASLPNRCLLCHQSVPLPHTGICPVCLDNGLYQGPVCLGCGRDMQLLMAYCGQCQKTRPMPVIAPCSYHRGLGQWVAAMKYRGQLAALSPLCQALARRIHTLEQASLLRLPQLLVPVPLHPLRLRHRGFNQAFVIAKELSRLLGLPLQNLGLVRQSNTAPQAGLTGKQRRRNLDNAFTLDATFDCQRIALVDDVVTTGTTAREIARLFEAQHIHVQVWCLARAEAPGLGESLNKGGSCRENCPS